MPVALPPLRVVLSDPPQNCACGCGKLTPPGRKYVDRDHGKRADWRRANERRRAERKAAA